MKSLNNDAELLPEGAGPDNFLEQAVLDVVEKAIEDMGNHDQDVRQRWRNWGKQIAVISASLWIAQKAAYKTTGVLAAWTLQKLTKTSRQSRLHGRT
jgi:hypothetical protein